MGLDVHMIGGHSLAGPLADFPIQLNERFKEQYADMKLESHLRRLVRSEFFLDWSDQPWSFDPMGLANLQDAIIQDNCVCFSGPWGLSIRIGLQSFDLSCPMRWRAFLFDPELADRVLDLFKFITTKLGGVRFVVVPDNATVSSGFQDLVTEDRSIDAISDGLAARLGKPSSHGQLSTLQLADPDLDGYLSFASRQSVWSAEK